MVTVVRNDDKSRYEARVDGELAGFAAFELTSDLVVFTHTEVDPSFEGQGVGSAIAQFALDDVRDEGSRKVRPQCPFINTWIGRHPDFAELVDAATTSTLVHPSVIAD